LPVDSNISFSIVSVTDNNSIVSNNNISENTVTDDSTDILLPPNTQLIVPNLDITATEVELILERISGRDSVILNIPVLSVQQTPIDKVSRKNRIFAIAFPTLYSTGCADFNTSRLQKVDLYNYI
jgi:hypothetical protein